MTKRVGLGLVALLIVAFLAGMFAGSAAAVVDSNSRVVVVDLPPKAEGQAQALLVITHVDGGVMAFKVKASEGKASFLSDSPADIVSVGVKLGGRIKRADNFVVTNIGVAVEGYGRTVGCPWVIDGEAFAMVSLDGSIVWLNGEVKTPAYSA